MLSSTWLIARDLRIKAHKFGSTAQSSMRLGSKAFRKGVFLCLGLDRDTFAEILARLEMLSIFVLEAAVSSISTKTCVEGSDDISVFSFLGFGNRV